MNQQIDCVKVLCAASAVATLRFHDLSVLIAERRLQEHGSSQHQSFSLVLFAAFLTSRGRERRG